MIIGQAVEETPYNYKNEEHVNQWAHLLQFVLSENDNSTALRAQMFVWAVHI